MIEPTPVLACIGREYAITSLLLTPLIPGTGMISDPLHFLNMRQSIPARQLGEPAPDAETLLRMLGAACRVPDHGNRIPFRFIQIDGAERDTLGEAVAECGKRRQPDADQVVYAKDLGRFSRAPLVIVVVAVLDPEDARIPEQERILSAGCTCFALLQAAQALGYGANWVTGWPAYDLEIANVLGLDEHERIVGFVHIGTPKLTLPDRARPDPARLLTRWNPDHTHLSANH